MTPTQIARRSDALYADGTCGMTRRVLCDMVAQRESDLEDARAENANLREYIERKQHLQNFARLVDENSKLRKLVKDMLDCIEIRAAWHRPPTEEMCEEFAQRARELRIEVDG